MSNKEPLITLSVVSHNQYDLMSLLLADLDKVYNGDFELIITMNIVDHHRPLPRSYIKKIIVNSEPRGFGANHNTAFKFATTPYFAVINPDIRLSELDCVAFLQPFANTSVGVVVPKVISPNGAIEDSVRYRPTFIRLLRRVVFRDRQLDYRWGDIPFPVEWAAGMFMVFTRSVFEKVGGFDDKKYFMYFEDVDICRRIWKSGWSVIANPSVTVVHAAQRASKRSIKHLRWHVSSAIRYLTNI
ncbi:MAG: glycosyltransferase [Sphingorhabdus sp.]|uniref:glycosyltransferase n=1 Tax=Sphingorhabdus sp. TaxID=1902408 RepID=UPI0025DFC175|nr:glycosyltransferase [Sphingorhabdus sp.]MCO4090758.1 glycosyltransferase [Sphingorhabdus sp.]